MKDLTNYLKFLNECKLKVYSEPTHKHHILPKHMGGNNDKNNLIQLSYVDHQKAHIILAECFNEDDNFYKSNIQSANLLNRWVTNNDKDLLLELSKIKTKQLYEWWSSLSEYELDEYKLTMSKAIKSMWVNLSEEKIKNRNKKISQKLKGRIIYWNDKISENHADVSGVNNPMYGKTHSRDTKDKISKKLKGNCNLGGRIGKAFSTYKFYMDDKFMFEANGQKEAKDFCKKENISFQSLCKNGDSWNNWFCERKRKVK